MHLVGLQGGLSLALFKTQILARLKSRLGSGQKSCYFMSNRLLLYSAIALTLQDRFTGPQDRQALGRGEVFEDYNFRSSLLESYSG